MRTINPTINRADQDKWQLGGTLPGVGFKMNAAVLVISGPVKGRRGRLISILRLLPEPAFHLETMDGGDEHVFQSEIASV